MKQFIYALTFIVLNFGGLAIGSWLMNNGPQTSWYFNLNKAPWTPPGWVFGVAWTSIMLCFSTYLSKLFIVEKRTNFILILFLFQFFLNVSWNYFFFNLHLILLSVAIITILTLLIFFYFFRMTKAVGYYKFLLLPYMLWLCIASSLNLYIFIYN